MGGCRLSKSVGKAGMARKTPTALLDMERRGVDAAKAAALSAQDEQAAALHALERGWVSASASHSIPL